MNRQRASATALLVASSVLRHGEAHGLGAAARDTARAGLRVAAWPWRLVGRLCRLGATRRLLDGVEARILPGLGRHHCRRKAWLQGRLRGAELPQQVLWLGVGLDAGHASLEQAAGRILVETDHPATLALRRRAVAAGAAAQLPLQLPDDHPLLRALCRRAPTLLVAEGLAMYLPPRPLLRLLRNLARLEAPPRLLFTALDAAGGDRGFRRDHAAVRRWLARRHEPFLWRLPPPRLARLLARHGYRVRAAWDGEGFGEYALDAVPLAGLRRASAAG